jgi:hypothetical protein
LKKVFLSIVTILQKVNSLTDFYRASGACARAASGQAALKPTIPLMKSRRRIAFVQGLGPRQIPSRLQQGFATGEMGFWGQGAGQQS